jgi:hypothetical protein
MNGRLETMLNQEMAGGSAGHGAWMLVRGHQHSPARVEPAACSVGAVVAVREGAKLRLHELDCLRRCAGLEANDLACEPRSFCE